MNIQITAQLWIDGGDWLGHFFTPWSDTMFLDALEWRTEVGTAKNFEANFWMIDFLHWTWLNIQGGCCGHLSIEYQYLCVLVYCLCNYNEFKNQNIILQSHK